MESRFASERLAIAALIASTGVLVVGGALAQFLDLPADFRGVVLALLVLAFAAVCGLSLWVANIAAGCAQILAERRREKPWALGIALFTAALTGLVSVIGVDLAWLAIVGERQTFPATEAVLAAGFALGFVKVAMGFVLTACEQIDVADRRADDAAMAAKNARIRELERQVVVLERAAKSPPAPVAARPSARPSARPPERSRPKLVRTAAAAASALALAGAPTVAAANSPPIEPTARTQPSAAVSDAVRAEARARIAKGESPAVVSKETGVPPGTCRRWACELAA